MTYVLVPDILMLGNAQPVREKDSSGELAFNGFSFARDLELTPPHTQAPYNFIHLFPREGKQFQKISVLQVEYNRYSQLELYTCGSGCLGLTWHKYSFVGLIYCVKCHHLGGIVIVLCYVWIHSKPILWNDFIFSGIRGSKANVLCWHSLAINLSPTPFASYFCFYVICIFFTWLLICFYLAFDMYYYCKLLWALLKEKALLLNKYYLIFKNIAGKEKEFYAGTG